MKEEKQLKCPDCGSVLLVNRSLCPNMQPVVCYTGTKVGTSQRICKFEGFLRESGEITPKMVKGKRCQEKPEPPKKEKLYIAPPERKRNAAEIGDRDIDYRQSGDVVEIFYRGRWRFIGKIRNGEYIKYENANGLHQKTDSFGIPYTFLKWLDGHKVKFIKIWFQGIHHDTTVKNWLERGEFLYFKGRSEKRMHLTRALFIS